jgi:hypothetical protein
LRALASHALIHDVVPATAVDHLPLSLTHVLSPIQARVLGRPDRIRYALLPVSETHFVMPPALPLEDMQTVAIYDSQDGMARYLHTNCRVNPRIADQQ